MIALQSIVSRNCDARDSAVVTIGTINGGTQGNIIADKVQLVGTLRTLNPEVRAMALKRIEEIVTNIPKGFGGSGEFIREEGYTALINHDKEVDIIKENATELLGADKIYEKKVANMGVEDFAYFIENTYTALINHDKEVDIIKENATELLGADKIYEKKVANMGVEDFAYFIENTPGAFFTLGVKNQDKGIDSPAHNGLFDIDEDALPIGVEMQIMNIYSSQWTF